MKGEELELVGCRGADEAADDMRRFYNDRAGSNHAAVPRLTTIFNTYNALVEKVEFVQTVS